MFYDCNAVCNQCL